MLGAERVSSSWVYPAVIPFHSIANFATNGAGASCSNAATVFAAASHRSAPAIARHLVWRNDTHVLHERCIQDCAVEPDLPIAQREPSVGEPADDLGVNDVLARKHAGGK